VKTGELASALIEADGRVLGIQTKLHRWAAQQPGRRFDDLFNLVCDPAVLLVAWWRVRGNRGARTAGVDGITAHAVRLANQEQAPLEELRADLKGRRFRPLPVRERMIPKTGGTLRRLGIPTVRDRVVQAALKLVLEPIFEADFHPCSYGFRPGRRAQDAIAEIHLLGSRSLSVAGSPVNRGCACWSCSFVDGWTRLTEPGSRRSARARRGRTVLTPARAP
jgi:RNA-directed DNA polymerase